MSPVAAIVFTAHDKAFLTAIKATGVSVYTITREGSLSTVTGPRCARVAGIQASHVVWIGVPKKWVKGLGELPFVSSYVGHHRWSRVAEVMRAVEGIHSGTKLAHAEAIAERKLREQQNKDRIATARRSALMAPPDYYIPRELR